MITTNSSNNSNDNIVDLDVLVSKMEKEDSRNLRLMRNFKWIYFVFAITYAPMILNPNNEWNIRIAGVCNALAFILFALAFRKFHKIYKSVDYSVPLLEMLTKAVDRYKLKLKRIFLVVPSVLLVDVGLVLTDSYGLDSSSLKEVVIFQVCYFGALTLSGFIGYLIWRKRQKPLRDEALRLLKDLES